MKISEVNTFHGRWEDLQKVLGKVLSLAHTESWVSVDTDYKRALEEAKEALDNLSVKSLVKEDEEADKTEWKNGEMTKGKWLSNFDKCDICGTSIKGTVEWFVDGRMKAGSWALMCPRCFENNGVGLGIGFGQKYDGTTAELIEGGFKKGEVE